ncbi:HAMP domain-containing histidine kinase [Xinfangfangia sp. D13-10-4-6]|uniref:sensor histidine kinase n=1 Tax=Pseudogemmobacter hezensis TaxID=2737662 RepID=UPI001556B578|nr:HAMP domain-containing sensor histidine kinase [Pseudogemmobacter hezensis]NPD15650.1 HAMP domain-containing histidine kinase [Pseudogemmobacter hezensis]
MSRRWRPSLGLVLGGALAGTLGLSFLGMVVLRYLGPVIGFRHAVIVIALVIAAATAVLGWLLVRLLLRPILALEHFAAGAENGEPLVPPTHFGTYELHATAQRVIAMAGVLRDREATVRAYTDHVTHELKTPVAAIRAGVELLDDGAQLQGDDALLLAQIGAAGRQIEAQLAALREVARAREARYLGESTLSEIEAALAQDWPDLRWTITGQAVRIPISAQGLGLILSPLARNASEHGATEITLSASLSAQDCVIHFSDNGHGISPGNAARIFDPFFTTRRESGGTGMGLAILRAMLAAHGGRVSLAAATKGSSFRLTLPRRDI